MAADCVALSLSIDKVDKEVVKLQQKEITDVWKICLLQKLEKVKEKIENLKTPSFIEPDVHPLKISLVLKRVLDFVNTPSTRPSLETLKALRSVSLEWNTLITPILMTKSNVNPLKRLEDSMRDFGTENVMSPTILNFNNASLIIRNAELLGDKEDLRNWLQIHGHKFIELSIGGGKERIDGEKIIYPMLENMLPNLQTLNLYGVDLEPIYHTPQTRKQTRKQTPLLKVKHISVTTSYTCKENVIESAMEIMFRMEHFESLTLNLRWTKSWQAFFSSFISNYDGIFKNLSRLDLLGFYINKPVAKILKQVKFPNLKHLRIQMYRQQTRWSFSETFGENLERLEMQAVGKNMGEVTYDWGGMSKLQVFDYSFNETSLKYTESDSDSEGTYLPDPYDDSYEYEEEYEDPTIVPFSVKDVVTFMPGLKEWNVIQCKLRERRVPTAMPKFNGMIMESCGVFSDENCGTGECFHIEQLLVTGEEDELNHECLEKLHFSCSFKLPGLVAVVASAFGNLKELSIWIKSKFLNNYFSELLPLEKLKVLKISLTSNVEDFAITVNSKLPEFKNLKELLLQKCSYVPVTSYEGQYESHISGIYEAHTGFTGCKSLKILSFKNMKVDAGELDKLRETLRKNKPDLAINFS